MISLQIPTVSVHARYRLEYLNVFCLLGAALFLPVSIEIFSGFLFGGGVLWLGKMAATRKLLWRKTPLDAVIVLYVFFCALSIFNSPDKNFSFYNFYHLMGKYILTYYLFINNVNSLKQLKLIVSAFLTSAALVIFYGFYQYVSGVDISAFMWVDAAHFPDMKTRVFSTLGNPNLFAGFLVMTLSLYLGLSLYEKQPDMKKTLTFLACAAGVCLVLTYSRGLWLSVLASLFVYVKFYDKRIIGVITPILVLIFLGSEEVSARAASIIHYADSSSALRFALWDSTWQMICAHPALGIGWGAYWLVYPDYDYFINNADIIIYHAHNMYLNIAAETGFLGLAAFLGVLFGHIRIAFHVFRTVSNCRVKGLMLGVLAAMAGIMVSGFTDYVLFSAQMSMLFWLLNAMVIISWQLSQKRTQKKAGGIS